MAKQIKGSDIIEPKHLQEAVEQARLLKQAYLDLDKQVKTTSASLKGVATGTAGKNTGEIAAITEAYKKSNTVKNSAVQISQQLRAAEDEEVKARLRLQQATAAQKKILTEEIALENKELGTLQKLAIESNKLRREREQLNLETAKGVNRLKEINTQLDKNNKIITQSSDALKKQKLNVGNYQGAVNKLTGALGQLGLAFSAFTIMRDVFKTVVDFEKATASLSAITGATGSDLTALKGTILDLATSMKVGVTETTKLFEIVGSQMPQLLKDSEGMKAVAESAIVLSKASGDSIEASTLAMASVMNQFKLEATESARVMNVLAAGSLVGSAGISDVSEAMKNFGSVASGANITVEESVALIEVLGKFGVVGAESGTKLRGSILKLQQASFGYASGQFEVNDALEEAKAKFDSLGSAMEQDAFLQKTFGAENISTGKILLSNIGLFEEYTKGVTGTNVATEQAAINSDTMATVVNELKAAWQNLIVEWSEGTDVLGGAKTVLRFIADNLKTIVTVAIKGVVAWGSYKLALYLVNKEGTGFLQLIAKQISGMITMMRTVGGLKGAMRGLGAAMKSIPFAGWASILVTLVPLVTSFVSSLIKAEKPLTAMEKITTQVNAAMATETVTMRSLFEQLKRTNEGSEERVKLIDEINSRYGTTLQNLDDEASFVAQVNAAYQNLVASMKARITTQVIQQNLEKNIQQIEELKQGYRDLSKLDPNAQASGIEDQDYAAGGLFVELKTNKERMKEYKGMIDGFVAENEKFFKMLETQNRKAEELAFNPLSEESNNNAASGIERTTKEVKKLGDEVDRIYRKKTPLTGIDLTQFDPEEDNVYDYMAKVGGSEYQKYADEQKRIEEEAAARRRKMAEESIALAKKITDALADEIDRRIEIEQNELAAGQDKLQYLREQANMGNVDAAESIKAQEIANAQKDLEIKELEKKKRNLMLTVTALELASQKINSGDGNALSNAGTELATFIAKLPKFYEGTEGTVADALGKPLMSGRDGYITRVDGSEMILNGKKTSALQNAGLNTTSDVANAALAYSMGVVNKSSNIGNSENILAKKLDSVEKAIKSIDIPENRIDYNTNTKIVTETIAYKNRVLKNHQKIGGLYS